MKKIPLLLLLAMFCISSYSQKQKEYIEKDKNYAVARIYQKNYKIIKVRDLKITDDTVMTYQAFGSSQSGQLMVNDVKYISVRKGSKALTYGLIGAGIGLASSLIGVLSVSADPYTDDSNVNWAPFIIGFTVGCGAVGAIIGAFNYKWKRLYFQSKDLSTTYILYPKFDRNSYSIGLLINF